MDGGRTVSGTVSGRWVDDGWDGEWTAGGMVSGRWMDGG